MWLNSVKVCQEIALLWRSGYHTAPFASRNHARPGFQRVGMFAPPVIDTSSQWKAGRAACLSSMWKLASRACLILKPAVYWKGIEASAHVKYARHSSFTAEDRHASAYRRWVFWVRKSHIWSDKRSSRFAYIFAHMPGMSFPACLPCLPAFTIRSLITMLIFAPL